MKTGAGQTLRRGVIRLAVSLATAALLLTSKPAAAAENGPVLKEAVLAVDGMICSSCSATVENALKRLPGVATATADIKTDRVTVRYDANKVTPRQMEEALRKAGYRARWLAPPAPRTKTRGD